MTLLPDLLHEYHRHKGLAEKAIAGLSDEQFFLRPDEQVNPVALIVKHLAGNLASRWRDFLTTDGDKPDRDRDSEFLLTDDDTREHLMARWEAGWQILFDTLEGMTENDLDRTVTIRGEPHTVCQALLRGLTHTAYHAGQILYLTRMLHPNSPWLTIAPGQSRGHPGEYLKKK